MSKTDSHPPAIVAIVALGFIVSLPNALTSNSQRALACLETAGGKPVAPPPAEARYRIDAGQSRFTVRVFVGGLLSAFGHDHTIAIRDFSGEAEFTYETVEPASLQMTIKADSLSVTDKVSDSDRRQIESTMREKVLETAKYPTIVFKSASITAAKAAEGHYQARITGELTLHGVTRPVALAARLDFSADSVRARGEFPLRQTDYKIEPVSVAAGTIKVKNELKLSFDIRAHP